ncbi:CHAT domain-containing protein [Nostoc sp. LEGE 12447]|nr:CHAT domain-containing protein [Nostoc sp. LEGE 12447]
MSFFEKAQQVYTQEDFLEDWAAIQRSLGFVYYSREFGNRSENLEKAISLLDQALQVYTQQSFPKEWGLVQIFLGEIYLSRIRGEKAENLEQVLTCYQNALQVYTPEISCDLWAAIQNCLGKAYFHRIHGDHKDNLEKSIIFFERALQIFTREAAPESWAETQNNLGNVYCKRIRGKASENQKQSILCLENSLQVYNRETYPETWATIQGNLAIAYQKLIEGKPSENIERAIVYHQKALLIHTQQAFPEEWAKIQHNLGNAYNARVKGNEEENLELAINAYQAALQIRNFESFPQTWANTQNSLGTTYIKRIKGDKSENLVLGIAALKAALKINSPDGFPNSCWVNARNLGYAAFTTQLWSEAIYGYEKAINAIEKIRTWVTSEFRRQEILEEAIDVYEKMVQACINAGQIEKAFEYSERSRSKRLVDLMASNNLYQSGEIPPAVAELLQQYEELQRRIEQERQSHKSENNRSETRAAWEAYNEAIASLEAQKQQVWENLRREDPVLAGEIQVNPLSLSEIQKLIDQPNIAILSFYTTNSNTHIFVVQKHQITLHTCTGQGLKTLQGWINQNWLLPYMNDYKKWETQINSILRELAERLQISELISQHLQRIEELILVPHLLLHQIPFAALPTGEYQEYLGDKFLIRYTPSGQILEFCQQRDNVGKFNEISLQYGTVEDAEDNLPCARFEGEKLAQMYNIPPENRLIGSSQATSNNYRQLAQQVQVLHSCHHAQSRLDNPLESQLKLADGSITLGQLMTPSWRLPQLIEVFLSCCETNLGTPSLTDDILTLSTGFLCAGARSVVSTLWSVNDLATALFSIFYYQQRQEGKNRPEALQQAQIQLREFTKIDLKKVFHEVEVREKELIRNRKKHPSDSIEYEQWKREYNMYAELNKRIIEIENSTQQFPFSDPRYWAAFICHGLR